MEERPSLADEGNERIGRDIQGQGEPVPGGLDELALEVLALGEGEGVDEDVELAVLLAPALEHPPDLVVGLNVARFDEGGPETFGERADAPLDEALDRREADGRSFRVERLGDAPCN